jgi:DNA polymerase-3 subunit alpha
MMKSAGFIHLHNHSEYSLLDGMLRITDGEGKPSDFLKGLAEAKIPALAFTDHGNMYGAMEFYFTAQAAGIRPIIGCEVYTAKGSRLEKDKSSSRKDNGHLTVLARNQTGYRNLMKLVSNSFLEGFYHDPRIDMEVLERHHEGLTVLSGCLKSHLSRACALGEIDEAVKIAVRYSDIMGKGNFFLELMDHGIPEEAAALKGLLEVAKRTGLPVVATNDCHYLRKEDWEAHDVHICISTGSLLSDPDRMKMSMHELYFKSPEEMSRLFSHTPEAVKNTIAIAEMCDLKLDSGKLYLPDFDVPAEYRDGHSEEEAQFAYLKALCLRGLEAKLGRVSDEYKSRLVYELGVIKGMGFSSYFLIVMDFIVYARSHGVPVGPGRGSGAGSLVAFALDITRVDPIVNGLLFERFLNPDRKSMPDLDIDFADSGRETIVEYVRQKYGVGNVANIITYNTIKAKTAVKDVGRVMSVPLADVNAISKLLPDKETLYKAINTVPELRERQKDPKIKKMFEIAQKIEGLRRQTSVHAAGVVITKEQVTNYVPLANRNNKNVVTTQYDGNMLTRLGLLKVDFLGLRTLTIIETALELMRGGKNGNFDIYQIPLDDKKTYELLCEGRTTGVFQLESEGMRKLIKGLKPSQFSDIAALVALYRPGPIQSGMLELFVERKHGRKKIVYDHPVLEPILKDTYGTMVYQEQVMEISKKLARFTPGEADSLRKAMGKKKPEEMEQSRVKFTEGAKENGIPLKLSTKIFDQILQFAGYGFNKSHSVAYALVAYQTAWLKANFPVEFMCALLTSEIGHNAVNSDEKENKQVTYIGEAQAMEIEILGPDLNHSGRIFTIEEKAGKPAVRFALTAVKNVGEGVVDAIVSERDRNGPFRSFEEFTLRADGKQLNKRVIESMAKSGALDGFYPSPTVELARTKALKAVESFSETGSRSRKEQEGQDFLFGVAASRRPPAVSAPPSEALNEHTILKYEKEVLGFYFSGHPLNSYRRHISMISNSNIEKILTAGFKSGDLVRVAGIVLQSKVMQTKKGDTMAKFELEDLTGSIGVCLFPRNYAAYGSQLAPNKIVVVAGKVQESDFGQNPFELVAEEVLGLFDAMNKWGRHIMIRMPEGILFDEKQLSELKHTLNRSHGECPVYLKVNTKAKSSYIVETSDRVVLNEALFKDLEKILGVQTWQVESTY